VARHPLIDARGLAVMADKWPHTDLPLLGRLAGLYRLRVSTNLVFFTLFIKIK
jgi:hypothetical protein